jgi:glyoxylase-like metal-dependent hydrolase (beta-lactamase superfamily II)
VSVSLPPGVTAILAPNPSPLTGAGTTTYVVGGAAGCVVIDPGPAMEPHLEAVADQMAAHGGARAILVTHGHPDHADGAARLRELTGGTRVLAWSREGVPGADATLADGAEIDLDAPPSALRLIALHTPGHRFDHLCFLRQNDGVLFAGDLVAGSGTVVIAPPEGDLADYLASLRRLLALDLSLILPAHGPPISSPRALLEGYIQHRLEREAQVIGGLAAGDRDVARLVARIYAGVDPELHALAAQTVTAHLLKLEREGRVVRAGDGWRLRE